MEEADSNNIHKNACRLCDGNAERMYNIFDKNEEGVQILRLIKDSLSLIVYRTDPLPKKICESCLVSLNMLWTFRKNSRDIAERNKERLKSSKGSHNASIQLYLGCQESDDSCDVVTNINPNDVSTTTDDLVVLCSNCRNAILDASSITELEMCTDLHKVIADSLKKNKVLTESESEKILRSRRKRSQAFYHELEDSCSSMTEFSESSPCFDFASDDESYDSDIPVRPTKRRRVNPLSDVKQEFEDTDTGHKQDHSIELLEMKFEDEVEFKYNPLTLLQLSLNVINQMIFPGYKPDDFYMKVNEPKCRYCDEYFLNSKLLALHEVNHIHIELGEKVDTPILWHESRDDADVRNKWLTSCDGVCDELPFADENAANTIDSLLIPIGTDVPSEHKTEEELEEIVLVDAKPMVNGILLSDYSKEERKAFYATMRVGGVNKKFCRLCRYSFKDNWAIESHYFSSACYYTCRYCGMRFNKQRHRFKEHVQEHEERCDPLSNKVYAASKLSNVVPKVIQPTKVKKINETEIFANTQNYSSTQPSKMRSLLQRKSLQPNLQIKEEPGVGSFSPNSSSPSQPLQTSQSKTGNQAYFCRKCYKVFFKLDEFNVHSKSCELNQFSGMQKIGKPLFSTMKPQSSNLTSNGEVSSAGRPVRNCVKEIGTYKDEAYIPDSLLKETPSHSSQSFVCFICNTPFPTIYSRNSHMRIHKGETGSSSPSSYPKLKPNNYGNISINHSFNNRESSSYPNYMNFQEVKIKQEPLEPEVEIHESEQNYPNSVGAVSITPISKNPNQKPTINPNIMKLVQNNPHLTIKGSPNANSFNNSADRFNMASSSLVSLNTPEDKSYKCSNCWEAFANKSHLYFHKKNQCEGSRFPCPFCKKRFGTEAAYSSHIFYSHPE